MATRNRTALYRKHRYACKSVRAPLSSSASDSGGPVIEMVTGSLLRSNRSSYAPVSTEDPGPSSMDAFTVGLPPDWVDDSEEIAVNIQLVRTKMVELAKAHSKALMPTFGDGKEDQRVIEVLTYEITDLLRRSEKRLRKLSAGGSSEDSNIRKNVQHSIATDLQNLSMELRKKQSTYLKHLRQQKEGHDGDDLEMNLNENRSSLSENDNDDEFNDVGFNKHQMSKLKRSEHFSAEREREIKQVVESVNELAQIMKDLSVLVIDQFHLPSFPLQTTLQQATGGAPVFHADERHSSLQQVSSSTPPRQRATSSAHEKNNIFFKGDRVGYSLGSTRFGL